MATPPILMESLPSQTVLEGTPFPELDLSNYIISQDDETEGLRFFAELIDGSAIPKGLVCSLDGFLEGTPEIGTAGQYKVKIIAENDSNNTLEAAFNLFILRKLEAKPGEPVLVKAIPTMVVNIGAALGPIDLKQYIQPYDPANEKLHFAAELSSGQSLPQGIICTSTGILSGIPASGTLGEYDVHLTVNNPATNAQMEIQFSLVIKQRIQIGGESQFFTGLKNQIWDALEKNQPVPEFAELFNRQLTAVEIYYLMQRFATLTIYNVYDLSPPADPVLLNLPDSSIQYNIYDRGCCLIATPKELFSYDRTPADIIKTGKALAQEVFKRDWTIEMVGFQKMVRAAWVELQFLSELNNRPVNILHYHPTEKDLKLIEESFKTHSNLRIK